MGLTLRCRRYIFLAGGLHLELVHSLTSLGDIQLVIGLHSNSLLLSFSGKARRFPGENDFSFRKDIFSRHVKAMLGFLRKGWQAVPIRNLYEMAPFFARVFEKESLLLFFLGRI